MLNPLLSCSAVCLAAILLPSVASAGDEPGPPADESALEPALEPADEPADEPALESADEPAIEPALEPPPAAPAAAPAAASDPCASAIDHSCGAETADPCGGVRARWGKRRVSLAIGLSRGHVEMDDDTEGTQRSLIARLTGRRGWAVELELSKLKLGDDDGRLAGGAIVKAFGRRKLAPYVLAGAGRGELDRADGSEQRLHFAEVGGGLMLRKRRLSIGIDLRRGARHIDADEAAVMDPAAGRRGGASDDDRERYTRGRIVALVHF
jgi:hypothetical protein